MFSVVDDTMPGINIVSGATAPSVIVISPEFGHPTTNFF